MTNFDDLTNRILNNMDKMDNKLDDLCGRMTKVEASLDNHYKNIDKKAKSKERRFYYIIALMGIGFTVQEIIRSIL